ncbi:uncharacterized protein A1O9_12993 [Exophiala aquamarina CBS 119918]|uniref:Uncharacterized protein n=1 Tax=Exophiala aquamarina CBS 119918 TaxID=1182545 RepID=A0A072NSW4_9EURO|nr:uncharacterized protein A1O9_12993 [Exophiala aquamarina CBS 119918]KEF50954.1 hypothetical protein A1O9_12993 [Exophiala aquamarina CBS 119918]
MTRWIIDGSEELNYFNPEILEALHSCFMYNVDIDDHLRASYFFRAKLEMIKTYLSSEDRAYVDAEARFRDTYTEWNAPEVCELSQRLYYIDDNDVIDKIYMLKPNLNDNALKRASKATNGATNECCPLHVLADVALEDSTVAAKRQLKPDTGSKQDRPMKQELRALKVKNEIARVEAAKKKKRKSAVARSRRVQHRKFDDDALPVVSGDEDLATESATALRESCAYHVGEVVMDEMNEVAAVESDKAASLSLPAALNSVSGVEYAWSSLWVSSFAAKDSLSKQAWCSSQLLQEMMPFAPRDVEHLLASKDGLGSKNDGFGLKMRRDSCCGRVEGTKKFLDLEEVFGARKRAHTFGNDAGKKDLLKEVEV